MNKKIAKYFKNINEKDENSKKSLKKPLETHFDTTTNNSVHNKNSGHNKSLSTKKFFKEDELINFNDSDDETIEQPFELKIEDKDMLRMNIRRSINRKQTIEKNWKQEENINYKGKAKKTTLKTVKQIQKDFNVPRKQMVFTAKSIEKQIKSRSNTPTLITNVKQKDDVVQLDLQNILRQDYVQTKPKRKIPKPDPVIPTKQETGPITNKKDRPSQLNQSEFKKTLENLHDLEISAIPKKNNPDLIQSLSDGDKTNPNKYNDNKEIGSQENNNLLTNNNNFNNLNSELMDSGKENGNILVQVNNFVTYIPILIVHNKAKIKTVAGHKLLKEVLEVFLNQPNLPETEVYLQKSYDIIGNLNYAQNLDLLVDIDQKTTKVVPLLRVFEKSCIPSIEEMKILLLVSSQSHDYLTEILRISESMYKQKLELMSNWFITNYPTLNATGILDPNSNNFNETFDQKLNINQDLLDLNSLIVELDIKKEDLKQSKKSKTSDKNNLIKPGKNNFFKTEKSKDKKNDNKKPNKGFFSFFCCYKSDVIINDKSSQRSKKSNLSTGYFSGDNEFEKQLIKELTAESQKKYKGQIVKGLRHGYGTQYYAGEKDVIEYQGHWKESKKHGKGTLFYKTGYKFYDGEFKDDLFGGKGDLYDLDEFILYSGGFEAGKRSGKGKEFYKNGSIKYKGNFEEGMMNGFGVYHGKSCQHKIYEGLWKNNYLDGKGVEYFKQNNKKDENDKEKEDNFDKFLYERYEGKWREGKWHGDGTEYQLTKKREHKVKIKGRWRYGVIVE